MSEGEIMTGVIATRLWARMEHSPLTGLVFAQMRGKHQMVSYETTALQMKEFARALDELADSFVRSEEAVRNKRNPTND